MSKDKILARKERGNFSLLDRVWEVDRNNLINRKRKYTIFLQLHILFVFKLQSYIGELVNEK